MLDDTTKPVDKAYPFIYEGISLFTWHRKEYNEFQVVETTTGLMISEETTEEEAIKTAKELINQVGIDKIKERIIEQQKKIGYLPPKSIKNIMTL